MEKQSFLTERLSELRPKLHRYCSRMTGSVAEGEDVVQEVFIKALSASAVDGPLRDIDAWVFHVAHNEAVDYLRHRVRSSAFSMDDVSGELAEMHAPMDQSGLAMFGLGIFMHLTVPQRSCVILMDVLGYSIEEIAAITGGSAASIKSSLHRGRARLRELGDLEIRNEPLPALPSADKTRLLEYVRRFNAREFEQLRDMLAEDVHLDLVGRRHMDGKEIVGTYFSNYAREQDWHFEVGYVDGRLSALVLNPNGADDQRPCYFVSVDWRNDKVLAIRDFRYARYIMDGANVRAETAG